MFGLQGVEGADIRENGAPGHASDEIRHRAVDPLQLEQIHDNNRERLVHRRAIPRGSSYTEQSHCQSSQNGRGQTHLLRGTLAMLPSQRMVSTYTGNQEHDSK